MTNRDKDGFIGIEISGQIFENFTTGILNNEIDDQLCLSQNIDKKIYVSHRGIKFDTLDIELKAPLSGIAIGLYKNKVHPYVFALNYTLWISEFMPTKTCPRN